MKAKDSHGNTFIVEMQISESDFFHKRILYYTSQSYTSQITKGKEYDKLNPFYFIGILEFEVSTNPNYVICHKVLDIETNEHIVQDVEFYFIELPKFNKGIEQLKTSIDQWTYFIKNAENLEVIPDGVEDEGLKQAYLEADKHNWTQAELDDYERASIKEQDEIGRIVLREKRAEKRAEKRKSLEIGKKLKDKGMENDFIAETTGLTTAEIDNL